MIRSIGNFSIDETEEKHEGTEEVKTNLCHEAQTAYTYVEMPNMLQVFTEPTICSESQTVCQKRQKDVAEDGRHIYSAGQKLWVCLALKKTF